MNILDLLVGKPLATSEERAEQIGPLQGIPIFGLDALSSAAYGPEAALTLLIPLGLLGLNYILPAAVGISAGVGALISAIPSLQPHTLSICVGILLVVTIINLRGLREAGLAFLVPTYLFVATLLIVIGAGVIAVWQSGGHPAPLTPL